MGIQTQQAGEKAPELPVTKARYLELSLNSRYTRGQVTYTHTPPLMDLLRILEKARGDRRIRGVLLNASGFTAGREYLWELRAALERFQASGKRLVAFIDTADFDLYYLVSAADRIVMDGAGSLFLLGYSWGRAYVQQTLEKLGVGCGSSGTWTTSPPWRPIPVPPFPRRIAGSTTPCWRTPLPSPGMSCCGPGP
ncbi:MAG: hypothetical protein LBU21_10665 [Treponema sp.]|jgi:hypothetical protein|nr:hypothetical protein [Treponema sp.]